VSGSTNGQGPATRPVGVVERVVIGVVAVLLAGLAGLGAVVSFASVETAVRPYLGELAWTVPVGVDAGIFVFTVIDLVMLRLGLRTRWGRLVPWAFIAATIYLNVATETVLLGRVAHGVLPILWVLAVEYAALAIRALGGLDDGTKPGGVRRIDRVRLSRFVLAPWPTLRLWRRMRLWEIVDLGEGRRRDRAQDLARAALQDTFGPLAWRWRAPRQQRVDYRHGALTPAHVLTASDRPADVATAAGGQQASTTKSGRKPGGQARHNGRTREMSPELLAVGRRIYGEVNGEGRRLTRDELARRVRAELGSCPNALAGALLTRLQAESASAAGPAARAELAEVTR